MILFAADNHFGKQCGRNQAECLAETHDITFYESDWSCFTTIDLVTEVDLLVLNMISGTGKVPMPTDAETEAVRAYVEAGKPLFLLHGASAAFWQCDWWRPIVGHRWVRGNDPDGVASSTHPVRPFRLDISKTRHPLCDQLQAIDLPTDEIYTNLEQTQPTLSLMETTIDEGTFVQAYLTETPWGGALGCYIPGHAPDVVKRPDMMHNVRTILDFLLSTV